MSEDSIRQIDLFSCQPGIIVGLDVALNGKITLNKQC